MFLVGPRTVAERTTGRRFRLIVDSLKCVSTVSYRRILRKVNYLLRVLVPEGLGRRIVINVSRRLTIASSFELGLFSILGNGLVIKVKGKNVAILFLVRLRSFPFLIKGRSRLVVRRNVGLKGQISKEGRVLKRGAISCLTFEVKAGRTQRTRLVRVRGTVNLSVILSRAGFLTDSLRVARKGYNILRVRNGRAIYVPLTFFNLRGKAFRVTSLRPIVSLLSFRRRILPFNKVVAISNSFLAFSYGRRRNFVDCVAPSVGRPRVQVEGRAFKCETCSLNDGTVRVGLLTGRGVLLVGNVAFPRGLRGEERRTCRVMVTVFKD